MTEPTDDPAAARSRSGSGSESRSGVLVTGASGYLGRLFVGAMAAELAGDDPQLACLVATDVLPVPEVERVGEVTYLDLDVRDPALADVLGQHEIGVVVHLASIVAPRKGMPESEQHAVDVEGTRNVLDACLAGGVRKVIVTTSGAAYGYHADNAAFLTEDCPVRGHDAFAYARHKRLVEEMLASYREAHPELRQLVLRPGTILGAGAHNPVAAIFDGRVVVGLRDAATPFNFIWDQDVVEVLRRGVLTDREGIFNLAGDGVLTLREIAHRLGKPFIGVPSAWLARGLGLLRRRGLTPYGPEHVLFMRYRPVLSNERLKREFGFVPRRTSREVLDMYASGRA